MTPWLDDGDVRLYHGDCLDVLRELPDGSVDCIATSPPYWGLRDYGSDGQIGLEESPALYVERLVGVFRECRRVLADHGTCWVNLGDSYNSGASGGLDGSTLGGGKDNQRASNRHGRGMVASLKPKDLVGIPWRVAFALQDDGWWLRSDIIWAKPNPMPESVTDRPTKSHEYVFLLAKQPRYFFDQEAVREPYRYDGRNVLEREAGPGSHDNHRNGKRSRWPGISAAAAAAARRDVLDGGAIESEPMDVNHGGRNVRSVWEIATQPYPGAHFATFPQELVRRMIVAGCPERVCRECGQPSERQIDVTYDNPGNRTTNGPRSLEQRHEAPGFGQRLEKRVETVGWSDCGHDAWRPGTVLDPFMGSGTTALVARNHGRHSVGIELNEDYCRIAADRLSQLSLLTGDAA